MMERMSKKLTHSSASLQYLITILLLLPSTIFVSGECFNAEGKALTGYAPCSTTLAHSICCPIPPSGNISEVCDPMGFCKGTQTPGIATSSQVACTDNTWEAVQCHSVCSGSQTLLKCPDGTVCCNGPSETAGTCCDDGHNTRATSVNGTPTALLAQGAQTAGPLANGTAILNILAVQGSTQTLGAIASTMATIRTSGASPTLSGSASASRAEASQAAQSTNTTDTAQQTNDISAITKEHTDRMSLIIGVSFGGLALFTIIGFVLVYCFFRRLKNRRGSTYRGPSITVKNGDRISKIFGRRRGRGQTLTLGSSGVPMGVVSPPVFTGPVELDGASIISAPVSPMPTAIRSPMTQQWRHDNYDANSLYPVSSRQLPDSRSPSPLEPEMSPRHSPSARGAPGGGEQAGMLAYQFGKGGYFMVSAATVSSSGSESDLARTEPAPPTTAPTNSRQDGSGSEASFRRRRSTVAVIYEMP